VNNQEIPLAPIDLERFESSVHGSLSCVDCHSAITELVHDSTPAPAQCADCHDTEAEEYQQSIHGASHAMGASAAAVCADCHGTHEMLSVSDPASAVFKMNLPKTCAKCHANEGLTDEYRLKYPEVSNHYLDSIHGQALLKLGLIVAPSCNDCHGVHDIKRSVDRDSPIHRANLTHTCGKCHVTVESIFGESVHGRLMLKGDQRAPVCTDCHTAHDIEHPLNGHFKQVSDQSCGKCHEDRLKHYHETYHGKAMVLGRPNVAPEVAACYDCHGHHNILPGSDPASPLSSQNILETCQRCHPGASAGFVGYMPHANPLDRENYPALHLVFIFMTLLLISVFTVFGAHTVLWVARSVYLFFNDSKTFHEAKIRVGRDDEWFTRFSPFERFLHFLVVTSFLLLVITGMPLKFFDSEWAKLLFGWLGGPDVARWLHHFGAVVTFLYFGLHLMALIRRGWRNRKQMRDPKTGAWRWQGLVQAIFGPDSMVPTKQDWTDFIAHQKWFFGRGEKPQFDRWTYWEKFDYFAVFWGVFAIGLSGLIMWFPIEFTHYLPGWIINLALIVHSDEALLAAGFIFTIHFFNTHFRIEKFPLDTVIFTGRISKTELLHERRRWYDRLVATGRLDEYRSRDEWQRWKSITSVIGYFFFGLGVILLILIVYAMATRLTQ
jgi:cytochrome b subunit of formate dehydrogenase